MPASKTCLPAQNLSSMRNTARYTNKDGTKVITVPRSLSSTTSSVVPTDQSSALPSSSATTAATTVPSPSTLSATVSHTRVSAPSLPESDPVMSNISTKKAKKRQRQAAAKAAAANGNNTSSSAATESTFALGSSAEPSFLTATASGSKASPTEKGTLTSNAAQNLDNHSQDRLVASQLIASSDYPIAPATTASSSQSKKNKKRKKKAKKESPAPENSVVEPQYYQTRNSSVSDSHPYQQANHHHHHHHHHHHQQASNHPHHSPLARDDRVWDTKPHEDRERIKEFWLSLEEEERKSLVRLEKETVLKKMKDQQKNTCACNVCGRKRTAIERELEGLYDSYYRELEQYAQEGNATPFLTASIPNDLPIRRPPMPGAFPRTPGSQSRIIEHVNGEEFDEDEDDLDDDAEDDDAYSDEDYEEEYDDDASLDARVPPPRHQDDLMAFGNSLQVKEGILTVADDLLRNDGKRFIEMMEKLAERRMAREDSNYTSGHIPGEPRHTSNVPSVNPNVVLPLGADHDHAYEDATEPYDDEGDDGDDGDNYDDEDAEVDEEDEEELDDPRSEEQRMAEGRKMFQIFAARMFEQRVLTAYKKKLSAERSARLMEELDAEERERQEREAAKSAKQQRKREKERAKKQAAAEAKAQREAEKAAEEAAKKAEKEAQAAKARAKAEEKKRAKEAQRRAEEEERQRKEAERLHRLHEQERKNKEAKERQNKLREEQKQKEKEAREAKDRELREKQEQKEQKEREEKEKQEVLARERKAAAAAAAASAEQAKQALIAPASTAPLPPSATAPVAASTIIPASSAVPVTPSKPKATLSGITPGKTPMAAVSRAPSVLGTPAAPPTSTRKASITSGLHNVLPMHNSNPGTTYVSPKIPAVTPIMAAKVPTPIRSRAPSQQMADNSSSSAPSGSQASGAPSQNASPLIGSSIHTSPSPLSSMAPHAPNLPPAVNNHFYNNQPLSPTNLGGLKAMLPTHTEQFMSRPSTVGAPPPGLPAPSMPPGLYNGRPVPDGMYSRFGSVDGISAPPGLGVPPMKTFPTPPAGLNNMPFDAFGSMSISNFNFGMSTDANQPPSSGHGRQASASFDFSALGITNNKNGSNSMSKPAPIGRPGSVVHGSRSNSMPHDDVNEHLGSRALLDDAQDDILGPSPAPRQRVVSGAPGPIRPAVFSASPFVDKSSTFSLGGYSQWGPTTPSSGFAPPAGIWNNPTTPSSTTMPFPSSAGVSGPSSHPWRKAVAPPTLRRYLAQACQTFREAGQLVHPDGYADYGKIKMHIETQLHTEIDDRDLMNVTETLGNTHNGNGTFECRELGGGVRVIRWDPPVDPFLGSLQKPAVSRDSVDHVIGHGIGRV